MRIDYFSKPEGVCKQKSMGNAGQIQVNLGQVHRLGFSSSSSDLPCQNHTTSAPYWSLSMCFLYQKDKAHDLCLCFGILFLLIHIIFEVNVVLQLVYSFCICRILFQFGVNVILKFWPLRNEFCLTNSRG